MFRTITKLTLITAIFSLSAFSAAQAEGTTFSYQPFTAEYKLKRAGMTLGIANFKLSEASPAMWTYESKVKPKGLARMVLDGIEASSQVYITDDVFIPMGYRYEERGKDDELTTVDYLWDSQKAVMTHNGKKQSVALTDKHQDPYSLVLAIMKAAANGDKTMSYQVIDKSLKQRSFKLTGQETIKTPAGKYATLRFEQSNASRRSLRYWLSPALNYAPVQIERLKDGKRVALLTLNTFSQTK